MPFYLKSTLPIHESAMSSTCLSLCLPYSLHHFHICLSIPLSACYSVCLSAFYTPPTHLSIHQSVCLFALPLCTTLKHLSNHHHLSVSSSVCLCTHLLAIQSTAYPCVEWPICVGLPSMPTLSPNYPPACLSMHARQSVQGILT
jgi:hypothetical protein